jgi:hypothetical protein
MNAKDFLDILSGLVTVALVTTIVAHRNSAAVIKAGGNAFSGSITSALGGGSNLNNPGK